MRYFISLCLGLLLQFMCPAAWTQEENPLDLRILLDISSSTREIFSDNQQLEALSALVSALPDGSHAGVWTYGKYVNHLVTYDEVDAEWRAAAQASIAAIRPVAAEGNLELAISKASFDKGIESPARSRNLLVISSGQWGEQNPQIALDQSYQLYALTWTDDAFGVLNNTVQQTGGFSWQIDEADDLFPLVADWINHFVPANLIPLKDQSLYIDDEVTSFSALILDEADVPATFVSPSGQAFDQQSLFKGDNLTLLRIQNPELGRWTLSTGELLTQAVRIESEVQLTVQPLSSHYQTGELIELQGRLLPVTDNPVSLNLWIDGRGGFSRSISSIGQNGDFAETVGSIMIPGLYHARLTAQSLGRYRQIDRLFQVEQMVSIDLQSADSAEGQGYRLVIEPVPEIDMLASSVIATLRNDDSEWQIRTAKVEDGHWVLDLTDQRQTPYTSMELEIDGIYSSGRQVTYRYKPIEIEWPKPAPEPVAEVAVAEQEIPDIQAAASPGKNPVSIAPAGNADSVEFKTGWLAGGAVLIALLALAGYYIKQSRQVVATVTATGVTRDYQDLADQKPGFKNQQLIKDQYPEPASSEPGQVNDGASNPAEIESDTAVDREPYQEISADETLTVDLDQTPDPGPEDAANRLTADIIDPEMSVDLGDEGEILVVDEPVDVMTADDTEAQVAESMDVDLAEMNELTRDQGEETLMAEFDAPLEPDFEITLEDEEELESEAGFAGEWSLIDAESNMPSDQGEDLEIDLDEEDEKPQSS